MVMRGKIELRVHATCRSISNFACQHLMAASTFRDHAVEIEEANIGQPLGDFYSQIRSYVSGTVMSATASLEALINEFFIAEGSRLRRAVGEHFEEKFWGKGGIEGKSILSKYDLALQFLECGPMDKTSADYVNMEWLINFRNALVHFKPIWDHEQARATALLDTFASRFPLSPFMDEGADFFASKCMSAGCAKWCVDSALSFLRLFDGKAEVGEGKMAGFWLLERKSLCGEVFEH
jgi:hypothetical protein